MNTARLRREAGYLVELVGVTAVAVAQPVFEVIQQAPEELVNRRAGALDIVAFALLVTFGPAVLLWLLEQPVRLAGGTVRDRVHGAVLGLGVGLFVLEVLKSALGDEPRAWLWAVGAAVAVGSTVLLVRALRARAVLRYLALAAPVFAGLFLFASPVSDLVVAGSVDPADVDVAEPAPVVVIALDELPLVSLLDGEGRIDADTYPAFAELAGDSTWFRNTTGVSPITPSALPAILTGDLPTETFPAPVATRFNESIFTLLGGSHEVHTVETLTAICPSTICEAEVTPSRARIQRSLLSLARDVFEGVADPTADATELEFVIDRTPSDEQAPVRFREFATQVAEREGLTLDVGHFLLPHQPWEYLPTGRTYEAPDPPRSVESGIWFDQTTADEGRQRHLLQLRYTDRLLGHFLAEMQRTGRYDESLIILTADHGAAFTGGEPMRGISEANAAQIMWTPMFVKEPGQTEGAVDDRATETIDLVPTVADVLGIDLPWEVDGTSMFEPAPDDRPVRTYDWRYNELEPDDDGFVVLDREAGFEEVLASSTPLSGAGRDPYALFRLGEFGDLVGRRVDRLDVGDPAGFELSSDFPSQVTVAPDDVSRPA
ncbi:MAG TPA: sulfatase-like hydrolase/transferase, partial [Acidimicrobiales bacterium]|nr:sulfatase-like hydrolase/transferase [Acidimicrobiales bacterium]